MALRIRFQGGSRAGRVVKIEDHVSKVVFGRDPEKCNVLFPPEQTSVGKEHLALKRVLGRYRIVLSEKYVALVNGEPVRDGQELEGKMDLQLGPDGPKMVLEVMEGDTDLPSTRAQRVPQPGTTTVIGSLAKGLAKYRRLSAGLALVVLFLAILGWVVLRRTGETASEARGRAEEMGRAAEEANRQNQLAQRKIEALEEEMKKGPPDERLTQALASAAHSVFLVVHRDPRGIEIPGGTAWVAGQGILATNAHVAEACAQFLAGGGKVLVRSSDAPAIDHEVRRFTIHPGYEDWTDLLTKHQPILDRGGTAFEKADFVPACDVALLYVDPGARLPGVLPIAPKEDLIALRGGQWIGFVGFPTENIVAGGVNLKEPTPTVQKGIITAMTDFILGKGLGDDRYLIHHSLPVAGGASGSPVLESKGRVVGMINAGNLVGMFGVRVSVAGINYAQRADLVQELLDDEVGKSSVRSIQAERKKQWTSRMSQLARAQEKRDEILEAILDLWAEADGLETSKMHQVEKKEGILPAPDASGVSVTRFDFEIPPGAWCGMVAIAMDREDIDMRLLLDGLEEPILEDANDDFFPCIRTTNDTPGAVLVHCEIFGPEGAKFAWCLYRGG